MTYRVHKAIEELNKSLLSLVAEVEENVVRVVHTLQNRDPESALKIIEDDHRIDLEEVKLEEECLKTLALYQPVAHDLRFIIAILKINNDLERINDLAVNIAERVLFILNEPPITIPLDFGLMAEKVQVMLRESINALVELDRETAKRVCQSDDEVDDLNREMYDIVEKRTKADPSSITILLNYLSVSRHLERIADLATNIAEDVMYFIDGEIVRHRRADFDAM